MGDGDIDPDLLAQQIAKAKLETEKLEYELEEVKKGRTTRDAEARAKREQLDLENEERRLKNAETLRSAWKDAVPDLGAVDRGKTTVKDDEVMFSTLLATRALADAASEISLAVTQKASGSMGIVVTTDPDLISRAARYRQALEHIKSLQSLLESVKGPKAVRREVLSAMPALGVAAAAAKLLPGLLSLISAHRSVASQDLEQDEVTVAMAVAGALLGREPSLDIRLDKTRLLPAESPLMTTWDEFRSATLELVAKLAAEQSKAEGEQDAEWLAQAQSVLSIAQEALTGMTSIPQGATASPLVGAAAEEFLVDSSSRFVLVVRTAGSSATQLVSDRPLAMKDPVHVTATAAIAFTLVAVADSRVVAAGVKTGKSELMGTIGSQLRVE